MSIDQCIHNIIPHPSYCILLHHTARKRPAGVRVSSIVACVLCGVMWRAAAERRWCGWGSRPASSPATATWLLIETERRTEETVWRDVIS
jgi:hypothetical protein